MLSLTGVLLRAIPVLFSARIIGMVFLPLVGAVGAWAAIGWFAWGPLTEWIDVTVIAARNGVTHFAAGAIAALLIMLAAVLTALAAVAVLAMPVIVATVAGRDFAALARKRGGTFAGSLGNAFLTLAVYIPLWLFALLLLALPPVYLVVSLLLNAWLNQRLFRFDALATHASAEEMGIVIRGARGRLFTLGLVLAPLSLIPVVNLFAPIYAGIAFTYFCLEELAALRERRPDGTIINPSGTWTTPANGLTR
jgi:CysZ protein